MEEDDGAASAAPRYEPRFQRNPARPGEHVTLVGQTHGAWSARVHGPRYLHTPDENLDLLTERKNFGRPRPPAGGPERGKCAGVSIGDEIRGEDAKHQQPRDRLPCLRTLHDPAYVEDRLGGYLRG